MAQPYLRTELWSELLVQLDDDAEADQDILLVLHFEQLEHLRQNVANVRSQVLVDRQPVYDL